MAASKPTLRSLARALGLSHTTVSDALRGAGRVDPDTRDRVRRAARDSGYIHNPLAATLMSEMRRSRGTTFRGLIAAIDVHEPNRPPPAVRFHRELMLGVTGRGNDLGFKLEQFVVGRTGLTVSRLDSILQSRGIHGVLLLPEWEAPDWSELNWTRYAGVYADYGIERPSLHCVCCDHYRSMMSLLARLIARGYRRPGLFLQHHQDQRIQHRFSSAFHGFQQNHPEIEHVPLLVTPQLDRNSFVAWFKRHRPDVVLGHYTDTISWMESCGARIPATGYVCLNMIYKTRPCAAIDQQPREIGARSVELLVAQVQRNERGLPQWPTTTMIPAHWVDGPSVRPAKNGGE
jgi:DNA-binding LacI/PurR family transcriptional regulator